MPPFVLLAAGAIAGVVGTVVIKKIVSFFQPEGSDPDVLSLPKLHRPGRGRRRRVPGLAVPNDNDPGRNGPDESV